MSLNIKNRETEQLVHDLVAATGESITRAVAVAVQERLERVRVRGPLSVTEKLARTREIANDASARWVIPYGSTNHGDLLYDDLGLPK